MNKIKYYISIILTCFSFCSGITSLQTENNVFNITQDKLIKKVISELQSNAIRFDGENLTIYADPSLTSLLQELAGAVASTFLGTGFLFSKENKILSLTTIPLIIIFVIRFIKKFKLYSNNIPVIKMNNTGIIIEDSPIIKWSNIFRVSTKYSLKLKQYILNLYDKSGKISSILKPDDNFITIPISQISKIIKYCIDEINDEKKLTKTEFKPKPIEKAKPVEIKNVNLNIQSPIKKWLQQAKNKWNR